MNLALLGFVPTITSTHGSTMVESTIISPFPFLLWRGETINSMGGNICVCSLFPSRFLFLSRRSFGLARCRFSGAWEEMSAGGRELHDDV